MQQPLFPLCSIGPCRTDFYRERCVQNQWVINLAEQQWSVLILSPFIAGPNSAVLPAAASPALAQTGVARWFIFKPKKSQFRQLFEDLGLKNLDVFYGLLE
jgi:hypothetical protein